MKNAIEEVVNILASTADDERDKRTKELQETIFTSLVENGERNTEFSIKILVDDIYTTLALMYGLEDSFGAFIANGMFDEFMRKYMEKKEGSSCCADKSSFITRRMRQAIKEERNISLYDAYTEDRHKTMEEHWGEQAYWSPTTIKDTDEAKKLFIDWYYLRN